MLLDFGMRLPLTIFAALLCCSLAGAGAERRRVILFVENASGDKDAGAPVLAAAQALLSKRGFEVTEVREGAPPRASDAEAAVAVSIRFHLVSRARAVGPAANPAVGLTAELFEKGNATWRNSIGVIGEGATEAQLETSACQRLFWTMPAPLGPELDERNLSEPSVPIYEVPIDRLRSGKGPRFPLRTDRRR